MAQIRYKGRNVVINSQHVSWPPYYVFDQPNLTLLGRTPAGEYVEVLDEDQADMLHTYRGSIPEHQQFLAIPRFILVGLLLVFSMEGDFIGYPPGFDYRDPLGLAPLINPTMLWGEPDLFDELCELLDR